jgi:large subunit ribosomal protein L21
MIIHSMPINTKILYLDKFKQNCRLFIAKLLYIMLGSNKIIGENFMYALLVTGGKQYKVAKGDSLKIESLPGEVGAIVEFDKVLMVANGANINIGTPFIENTKVIGEIVAHGRKEKVNIIKFRRRKHHIKRMGHRQNYTQIKITDIAA